MTTPNKPNLTPSLSELDAAMARARKLRAEAFRRHLGALKRGVLKMFANGRDGRQVVTHWTAIRPWGPSPTL